MGRMHRVRLVCFRLGERSGADIAGSLTLWSGLKGTQNQEKVQVIYTGSLGRRDTSPFFVRPPFDVRSIN